MAIGKAVSMSIDASILARVDALQPTHMTRRPFVNQLLLEAVEIHEAKARQKLQLLAE